LPGVRLAGISPAVRLAVPRRPSPSPDPVIVIGAARGEGGHVEAVLKGQYLVMIVGDQQ
jgi:hypothetical protein